MITIKKIKDLDSVITGVAEYEAKIKEYMEAGGVGYNDDAIKRSDLAAILPTKLREDHTLSTYTHKCS